jgi:hypothetical protein
MNKIALQIETRNLASTLTANKTALLEQGGAGNQLGGSGNQGGILNRNVR